MNYESPGMPKDERDLRDRTKSFALRVVRMFSSLPKTTEAQDLGKQVLRSGTSMEQIIAKHFAAGAGRSSLRNVATPCAS
jgi:four helix bundle protein